MLDLRFIRENAEVVREALANRNDSAPIDEIPEVDGERHQKILELENLRRGRGEAARDREAAAQEGRRIPGQIRDLAHPR